MFFVAAILFAVLVCPILAQRGTSPTSLNKLERQGFKPYREKFALVVGIDSYEEGIPDLSYAARDARAIRDLLHDDLGFDVVFLPNKKATRSNILKKIAEIEKQLEYDDQFFFYFAGHGISFGEGSEEIGYLIPQDATGIDGISAAESAISMTVIRERIARLPAKHVLLMIDSCFGGFAAHARWWPILEQGNFLRAITNSKARQIITAGTRGQEVVEYAKWGHSALAYKVIDALKKRLADTDHNGLVTATELYVYLEISITTITQGRQTPDYAKLQPTRGNFVFVLPTSGEQLKMVRVGLLQPVKNGQIEMLSESEKYVLYRSIYGIAQQAFDLSLDLSADVTWQNPIVSVDDILGLASSVEARASLMSQKGVDMLIVPEIRETPSGIRLELSRLSVEDGLLRVADLDLRDRNMIFEYVDGEPFLRPFIQRDIRSMIYSSVRSFGANGFVEISKDFLDMLDRVVAGARDDGKTLYTSSLSVIDGVSRAPFLDQEGTLIDDAVSAGMAAAAANNPDIVIDGSEHSISGGDGNMTRLAKILLDPELSNDEKFSLVVTDLMNPDGLDVLITCMIVDTGKAIQVSPMSVYKSDEAITVQHLSYVSRDELFESVNGALALTSKAFEEIQGAVKRILEKSLRSHSAISKMAMREAFAIGDAHVASEGV